MRGPDDEASDDDGYWGESAGESGSAPDPDSIYYPIDDEDD